MKHRDYETSPYLTAENGWEMYPGAAKDARKLMESQAKAERTEANRHWWRGFWVGWGCACFLVAWTTWILS